MVASRPGSAALGGGGARPAYTPRPASARLASAASVPADTPLPSATPIPVRGLFVDTNSSYSFGRRKMSGPPLTPQEAEEVAAAVGPRTPRPAFPCAGTEAVQDAMRYTASPIPGGALPMGVAPDDESVIATLHSLDDIIRFFSNKKRCRTSPAKFIYMQLEPTPVGQRADPYRLCVIPQPLLPCDHFVFSEPTVVRRFADDRPTEVTPLTAFAREASLFRALSKIRFFRTYLICKAFVQWRRNIRLKFFLQRRREVGNASFLARHAFARNMSDLREMAYPLEAAPMVRGPTVRDSITREEFVAALTAQRNNAAEVFRGTVEGVERILALLCQRIAALADVPDFSSVDALHEYFRLTEEEAARKAGHRINPKAISMTQSKANNERRLAQLKCALTDYVALPAAVRLLDAVAVEGLFRNALRSVGVLANELFSDDEDKSVSFVISATMGPEGCGLVPSEEDMHQMVADLAEEIVGAVAFVPRIVTNRAFKAYQFEWRAAEGIGGGAKGHFPLADALRRDRRMVKALATLRSVISRDFAASAAATRHYDDSIPHYCFANIEWPRLSAEWAERIDAECAIAEIIPSLEGSAVTAEEFADVFAQIDEAATSVRGMHSVRRGCLVVTCAAVVEALTAKLRAAERAAERMLCRVAKARLERLGQSMVSRIRLLQDRPTTLARFAEFAQHLNNVLAYARDQSHSLLLVEAVYHLAEGRQHHPSRQLHHGQHVGTGDQQQLEPLLDIAAELSGPYESVIGGQTSESVLNKFESALVAAKDYREQRLADMAEELREEVLTELDGIITVIEALSSPAFDSYESDMAELMATMEGSAEAIDAGEARLKTLCEWEVLFGVMPTDTSAVAEARRRHREQHELWSTIQRWETLRSDLFSAPITEVDTVGFSKAVDELFTKTYNKLHPKHQSDATHNLLELLREAKQMMPTLLHLGNKHLKREHWTAILAGTGRPFDPSITLESLRQLRIFDVSCRELISEQSAMATGEAQLLATMADVEAKWSVTEFSCKPLRHYTDTFILDDVSAIVQQAEEHLLLIQGCLASRFVGPVRHGVELWERCLTTLTATIEEWVAVQRAWMYLEFIFSFEDIKHQMPRETQMFRNVDDDFREVIGRAQQIRTCVPTVCEAPVLETLREAAANLEVVQRHLEGYLETKRAAFPRFYFLSNDELISLLSDVRNPRAVRPHLRKCFENVTDLTFKSDAEVTALHSAEGEVAPLTTVVAAKGGVEVWLASLEAAMVGSLKSHMQRCLHAHSQMRRHEWLLRAQRGAGQPIAETFPAQCILAVDMVQWTAETESAITAGTLRPYYSEYVAQIDGAVGLIRQALCPLHRSLLGVLLVIDVHNRDVIETLIADGADSVGHFSWMAQMTYYADRGGGVTVRHVNATLPYSYEYLGSPKRLVITPLTDRAFLTCTQALHLNLGGAPQGPAGTGKTESVKDLGKALARQVVVFNCSDGMNTAMLGRMFAGLAQAGAWACFDEFNRIELEVLSVVAQQMLEITQGVAQGKTRMLFDGHDIRLHANFGVFITMNPGYAGRTELPDNLKALFRPVCMMVPDYRLIAEIMFFSEGFRSAKALSVKMTQLYKLASEQLSKQDHYDFGMRAVKSVLVSAGALKRASPDDDEDALLIRAMRDSNVPKFLAADAALFNAIIQDLYPGLSLADSPSALLAAGLRSEAAAMGLIETPLLSTKCLQLYDTMRTRHGVMLVGRTLTGKTTVMELLQRTLTRLGDDAVSLGDADPFFTPTHQHRMNPKAITGDELYGSVNATTREWSDGVLSVIVRRIVSAHAAAVAGEVAASSSASALPQKAERNWVVFDGPVDAVWIENMNTVLDDSKMLCLVNSERIKIPDAVSFVFEVEDLRAASPATVSRCGMVYLEEGEGAAAWEPAFARLAASLAAAHGDAWPAPAMEEFLEGLVKPFLSLPHQTNAFSGPTAYADAFVPTVVSQRARAMLQLLGGLVASAVAGADDDEPKEPVMPEPVFDEDDEEVPTAVVRIEVEPDVERGLEVNCDADAAVVFRHLCVFAFIWGFGGSLRDADRLRFSDAVRPLIRALVPEFPSEGSVFDYTLHKKAVRWVPWAYKVPAFVYNPIASFYDMIVPTPQTVATRSVLVTLLRQRHHVLLTGAGGTGKSVALQAAMFEDLATEDADSTWESALFVFSARTSPQQVTDALTAKLRRHPAKHKDTLCVGPAQGKAFVACIDDVNIPTPEQYGATPALELMRQIMCEGGAYDVKRNVFRYVDDVVFAATAGPPGGGRHAMPRRLASRFVVINQPLLDEAALGKICNVLLTGFFAPFAEGVRALVPTIANALLRVFSRTAATQLPMPDKSHYTFNSRDVGRVIQGLTQFAPQTLTTKKEVADALMHEMLRAFHDRLAEPTDRLWWHAEAASQISAAFGLPTDPEWPMLIYGDFAPSQEGAAYQRIELTEELWDVLAEKMGSYGLQYNRQLDLVMFEDAIAHLVRICRILRQPRGSALLVGMSGCGRQSLASLAAFICGSERFQITTSRGYGLTEFRADVKRVLLAAGCGGASSTLILSEDQLVDEGFLEDINSLLSTGEIAASWEPEEMEQIVTAVRPVVTRMGLSETLNVIKAQFVTRCRDYFHLVLTMTPVGEAFRRRVRMFPCLVNAMTIDWFDLWPKAALLSVATRVLQQMDAIAHDDALVEACGELTVAVHAAAEGAAAQFRAAHRRYAYITPATYLTYLETVATLYDEEQSASTAKVGRLRAGIAKIAETRREVDAMQKQLTQMKPQLERQSAETEAFAANVSKEQAAASIVAATVAEEEAVCAAFMKECRAIKDECQASLNKAMPEYHAALEALNSLNAKDINEARSYASPPKKVAVIMDAVLTVLDEAVGWDSARKVMGRPDFIQTLRNFKADDVPERILKRLKKFTEKPDFLPELVQSVSKACVSFCIWCRAIDKYGDVLKVVRPKEQQLKDAEARLDTATEALNAKQYELKKLEAKIDALHEEFSSSTRRLETLEKERARTETHLGRAGRILDGLGGEEVRWAEEVAVLEAKQRFILGSTFVNAAIVTYGGPFPASYRASLEAQWVAKATTLGFAIADEASKQHATTLADPLMTQSWVANGLPHDGYSVQNGAILSKSTRWCLCVDPQGQANRWIRNMYRARGLLIMKPSDPSLLANLEAAVRRGIPTLIENIGESVDAALNPILTKQVFRHAGATMIIIRDQPVEYHPDFMLFLTTRLPNPHYLPEVQIKTAIVNFSLTEEGLRDQFLGHVVRHEQRALEERAGALIVEVATQQAQLRGAQDQILMLLSQSTGNLLDDEKLIVSLGHSKETSEVITQSLAVAEQTSSEIEGVRGQYAPVARRAATVYSIVSDLAQLDHAYQYSLAAFTGVLSHTLRTAVSESAAAGGNETVAERCEALVAQLTSDAYENVCRGLFEKDKPVFAFLIASTLRRQQRSDVTNDAEETLRPTKKAAQRIADDEWLFFLRGSQGVLVEGAVDPPVEWLSEAAWEEVQFTKTLVGFPFDITAEIDKAPLLWKALYDDPFAPENETPPVYRRLSTWHRIVFMRAFKEGALSRLIGQFVSESLGPRFAESPAFSLAASFAGSSPAHPMVLLLSPGTDPTAAFIEFAEASGFAQMVRMLSLGQGQGAAAEQLVREAARSGHWVYLQNCHVFQSWMPQLEATVAHLSELSPHEDFRLWLTTAPSPDFPISVLQASVKVTREPPQGLRANFRGTLAALAAPQMWDAVPEEKAPAWHRLLFSVALLHASILERRRFGPLGWNIPYQWNDGDLVTNVEALKDFVLAYGDGGADGLPWAAMQFMVGAIHYGGRVTDQWDARCLQALVGAHVSKAATSPGHAFGPDGVSYAMPISYRTAADVLAHAASFTCAPAVDAPAMFGLHENAEAAYQARLSKALVRSVVEVQPRGGAAAKDEREQALDTIADLAARLPPPIDVAEAHPSTYALGDNGTITALGAVAQQEVQRYNTLLAVVKGSLEALRQSLAGTIVMGADLEAALSSLTYQLVPAAWERAAYPSARPLASWFADLLLRVDFFRDWNDNGLPTAFWLGGFVFPQGFLTAVLQTHSRQHAAPIDQLVLDATVTRCFNPFDSALEYITDGVYVHGLAIEGARWDINRGCIAEPLPRQLEAKMPIIWLLPVRRGSEKGSEKEKGSNVAARRKSSLLVEPEAPTEGAAVMYECPVYKISTRAGTLSTTGISTNFIVALRLPSGGATPSHWVSRGTALMAAPVE